MTGISNSTAGGLVGLFRATLVTLMLALLCTKSSVAQEFLISSFPVGRGPTGLAVLRTTVKGLDVWELDVANSAEDTVSIYHVIGENRQLNFFTQGIVSVPTPHALGHCGNQLVGVSPSTNALMVIGRETVTATIAVGREPYSFVCLPSGRVAVSNYGDSSVSIVDLTTLAVTATIPGVPGSKYWQGITGGSNSLWVAGTDANVITVIDVITSTILTQFRVARPTAVSGSHLVASEDENAILRFDSQTLQVTERYDGIPKPRFVGDISEKWGLMAVTATGEVYRRPNPLRDTSWIPVPGISGVATLANLFFGPVVVASVPASNSLSIIQEPFPQTPAPHAFTVSNGASFGTAQVAPGQLSSLFTITGVPQNFSATSLPLPRTLGGVTMKIGGTLNFNGATGNWDYSSTGSIDAPLVFVGPNQVNFQIPPGIALGDPVPVQLIKSDGSTLLSSVRITATAPGLFSILQSGQGQGAVLNQDYSRNGSSQIFVGAQAATRGTVIQIFATGGGDTTPALLPGEAAPITGNPLIRTNVQPTATIGGLNAPVKFSGIAPGYAGLWQINVEVPASVIPGPAVPLVVTSGGVSSNTVTIAVQ